MKIINRFTSLMMIMCLTFTSINFQSIIAYADIEENETSESTISTVSGDPLTEALQETDEEAPRLDKATINGKYLSLNFNEALDTEKVPLLSEFKVRLSNDAEADKDEAIVTDPVYTQMVAPVHKETSNPVYTSQTDTTIYTVSAEVIEISVHDNKVRLTIVDAITSSGAIFIDYVPSGDDKLCDKAGNYAEPFSNYPVTNITGGQGLPNFVVEDVYDKLDTSSLSEELAHSLYFAMIDYKGSREELTVETANIISILSQSDVTFSSLTDENKSKLCNFFEIVGSFFYYSEGKGESVQQAIIVYSKMLGYGLTTEEIEKSIQDNTRDEVIWENEQQEPIQETPKRLMRAAASTSTGTDPFFENKYDKKGILNAPFQHNNAATEQINIASGTVDYNVTDVVLPGSGGLDLVIERQYSTQQANYYDMDARLQDGTDKNGNSTYSKMHTYSENNRYTMEPEGTPEGRMGVLIDSWSVRNGRNIEINSRKLRELYNVNVINESLSTSRYQARKMKIEMSSDITDNMSAKQETVPITTNDKLWQMGTGWNLNFSYIDIDKIYKYKRLHLSDGREFNISENEFNGLGFYTYKDVIFTRVQKKIAEQYSEYNVRYIDGKKEYFDIEGRLIAIVDRFGNTIAFNYVTVNNMVDIYITDSLGRVTTIKNKLTDEGYMKILTLPDGQTIQYIINQNIPRTLDVFDEYESFPGQNNEYNLISVVNQEGEVTNFSYTDIECSSDFAARFKLRDDKFMKTSSEDDGDKYYPNYYAGLTKINYPTGLSVNYEYYPRYNNWYDFGCTMDIAIKKRYDLQNDIEHNEKKYAYSYEMDDGTFLYNADGYNNSLPEEEQFSEDYDVTEIDNARDITKKYNFDSGNGYCNEVKTFLDSERVETILYSHRVFNWSQHPSIERITTKKYDTSDKEQILTKEKYEYDDKGNVINYWSALAEGDTTNEEYRLAMSYDPLYNCLIEKKYKRDANTIISEQNTRPEGKKSISQSMVYENGDLKAKSEYDYDIYGNVTQIKKYTDVVAGKYIQTNNTYTEGTYLTGMTVQDVQDADGKNVGSVSGQATYDIYGRIASETDGKGNITAYTYDSIGRIKTIQYPDDSSKTYAYNTAANQTTVTDERGYVTQYKYDPAGNLTTVYAIDGGSTKLLKANEYDRLYRLAIEQNNLSEGGGANIYSYDYKDRVKDKIFVDATNKALSQEKYTYFDDKTIKTIVGDSSSQPIVTTEYLDKYGRAVKKGVVYGSQFFTTFAYNYLGELIKERSANANLGGYSEEYTTKYEYNFDGQVAKQYDISDNYVTTKYDAAGNKISVTDPKSNANGGNYSTIYTYDSLGRLIKTETPFTVDSKAITKYYYDANDNLVQKQVENSLPGTDATFTKVDYVYSANNQLIQVKSYNGTSLANQVDYEYDAAGNMTAMTTGANQRTVYEYDRYGNMVSLTDPLGFKETCTYDINGNLISRINKNGSKIDYTYDGLNRNLSQSVTEDGTTQLETMGYTATGMLAFNQNGNIRSNYFYDSLGNLSRAVDSNGVEKDYLCDINGNLLRSWVKVNGTLKKAMSYRYDKKDRLTQVYEGGKLIATYTYDVNGNRSSLTYGNGNRVDYAYNLANLVTLLHNKNGTSTLSKYDYTYYLDGNQATKADNKGRLTSYTYDGLGRLSKEAESGAPDTITKAYTFDAAGNRATMAVSGAESYNIGYAYDLNNRLATETKQLGSESEITDYYYDNNGNTIAKKTGTLKDSTGNENLSLSLDFKGSEVYQYDGFDRMIGVQNSSGASIYTYKPDGNRLSKTVNGETTTHVWEGQNIALELDSNGEVCNRYIRGTGLINSDNNGWYLFNGHGDVVQLANNTGTVTKEYAYDAFGNEKNVDAADTNPFRYSGEYYDKETGSIYLRARYYDPEIGRFTSEDTEKGKANDPLSLNLYTYCYNNPIIFLDPSGHIPTPMEAAVMADHIYSKMGVLSGGWKFNNVIPGGDNMEMGVYSRVKDDGENEYALVNKGTTPTSLSDWKNNVQQLLGTSDDMTASIEAAGQFVDDFSDYEITMVGHSKGGAEASANAVATNRNCIIFNPAAVNLGAYGLSTNGYTAKMTAYIVKGEILNGVQGWASKPIGNVVPLPQQYKNKWYSTRKTKLINAVNNHSMDSVTQALQQALKERGLV